MKRQFPYPAPPYMNFTGHPYSTYYSPAPNVHIQYPVLPPHYGYIHKIQPPSSFVPYSGAPRT